MQGMVNRLSKLTALDPSTMRSRWLLQCFLSLVCLPCHLVARPCSMPFFLHRDCTVLDLDPTCVTVGKEPGNQFNGCVFLKHAHPPNGLWARTHALLTLLVSLNECPRMVSISRRQRMVAHSITDVSILFPARVRRKAFFQVDPWVVSFAVWLFVAPFDKVGWSHAIRVPTM